MPGPPPRGDRAATPPSELQPIGRDAKLLSRPRQQSRRSLSDIAGLPIDARNRNNGLTRCRYWRTCWTGSSSGGTTCPPASKTARRQKLWMPCWSCAVTSKNSRQSSCQRASDETDFTHLWRHSSREIRLAASGAVHIRDPDVSIGIQKGPPIGAQKGPLSTRRTNDISARGCFGVSPGRSRAAG
jgi:hypothetical protein